MYCKEVMSYNISLSVNIVLDKVGTFSRWIPPSKCKNWRKYGILSAYVYQMEDYQNRKI